MSEIFPETVLIEPCSENTCSSGHKWAPQLVVTQCPGCKVPMMAIRMINCPICNEPQKQVKFRVDHVVGQQNIVPACRTKDVGTASVAFVTLDIKHAENAEKYWNPETGRVEPPVVTA